MEFVDDIFLGYAFEGNESRDCFPSAKIGSMFQQIQPLNKLFLV
jgi:hypothetical protein